MAKLLAEINKIKAETSKLWVEIAKFVIPSALGIAVGLWTQHVRVTDLEQKNTIAQNIIQENNKNVIDPLKSELSETTNELQKAKPEQHIKPLVYIQFQGNTTRNFINELREKLSDKFNAPAAERVAGSYNSAVRYFSNTKEEKEKARAVQMKVLDFYDSKKCSINLPVEFNDFTGGKPSPIEIWLADEDFCG